SPLSEPGPHGYPKRFAVRMAGLRGFKIYGADRRRPCHYVELHARQQVLRGSGRRRDKSRALVTVQENWPSWSLFPLDDEPATFTVTIHHHHLIPDPHHDGGDDDGGLVRADETTIDVDHVRCRPVTFRFQLAVPTTPADATGSGSGGGSTSRTTLETFEWRRAPPACWETRGIRKKTLPAMATGDERPPEEKFVCSPSGSVLVRLGGGGGGGGGGQRCAPGGRDRPMGFTRAGEEILASYARARGCGGVRCYFQFWGSAAAGTLGEAFTHVAVMTGLAVYQDEEDETAGRRGRRK
ncbi:hypothetical protein MYCTH_2036724, partial [Thermothelomyces thermophilus ATCC 42464]